MRPPIGVVCIPAIVIAAICPRVSALTQLGEARGRSNAPPSVDSEEYLLVQNARRFCDGAHILEADCENLLEDSLESCKGAAECTFLCYTAKKRYPPRSSAVSEILESSVAIPNSSASWLCSGSGWLQLYPKNGWVTAIKGSVLRDLCKPFTVWLNQTAECTQGDTLDVAREITPAEASQLWVLYLDRKSLLNRCANMTGCSFFTMVRSTFAHLTAFSPWSRTRAPWHSELSSTFARVSFVLLALRRRRRPVESRRTRRPLSGDCACC